MKKKFSKDEVEYRLMRDFWTAWENNGITEPSDEYWNGVVANMQEVSNKYKGTSRENFARQLMIALGEELDREQRAKERT